MVNTVGYVPSSIVLCKFCVNCYSIHAVADDVNHVSKAVVLYRCCGLCCFVGATADDVMVVMLCSRQ